MSKSKWKVISIAVVIVLQIVVAGVTYAICDSVRTSAAFALISAGFAAILIPTTAPDPENIDCGPSNVAVTACLVDLVVLAFAT